MNKLVEATLSGSKTLVAKLLPISSGSQIAIAIDCAYNNEDLELIKILCEYYEQNNFEDVIELDCETILNPNRKGPLRLDIFSYLFKKGMWRYDHPAEITFYIDKVNKRGPQAVIDLFKAIVNSLDFKKSVDVNWFDDFWEAVGDIHIPSSLAAYLLESLQKGMKDS